MNARRSRYTRFGVISELGISATEPHFGVHAHFDRPATCSAGLKRHCSKARTAMSSASGPSERRIRTMRGVPFSSNTTSSTTVPAPPVARPERLHHFHACGGVTPGPTSDTMSLAICALIVSLRRVNAIGILDSHRDGHAVARARTKAPLPHRYHGVLIEPTAERLGHSRRVDATGSVDVCTDDYGAFEAGTTGLV